ncbi:MAG TPA: efflux RND transporter periplasmic adaptor subunit [Longimicrobiales bacterium]|nr:efflux RND transporter periplasmic adaptor subunit [Longimicrobiales bacterium]
MKTRSTGARRTLLIALPLAALAAAVAFALVGRQGGEDARAVAAQAADPHGGHVMPEAQADAGSAGETDPHAGHDMTPGGEVQLTPEMARTLGVSVVAAEIAPVSRAIRATGTVAYDERRLATVTSKYSGFIEKLYVDFTGQAVRRGQPMFDVYSPELIAAQEELLGALRMRAQLDDGAADAVRSRAETLVDAARRRLLLWDVPREQVERIERSGAAQRTLTFHAPASGFVTEKLVQNGQAIEAGMPLYRVADLAAVWVEADIYEQDIRFVHVGAPATVEINAYPGEPGHGRVSYVYPEVRADTRTTRVRIELANPGARFRPGMYATVGIDVPVTERAVLVPRDAVMYSGTHAMVFVQHAPGVFRAHEVVTGSDAAGRTQILSGLEPGDMVVAHANFLLDSESRLTESMGAMPGMNH